MPAVHVPPPRNETPNGSHVRRPLAPEWTTPVSDLCMFSCLFTTSL